jgi:hypothetical protein
VPLPFSTKSIKSSFTLKIDSVFHSKNEKSNQEILYVKMNANTREFLCANSIRETKENCTPIGIKKPYFEEKIFYGAFKEKPGFLLDG